jgi:hypothetical protein
MPHGPEHHVEHAEHSAHAAHDPFDKRVTMTIAIVAALLAAVTLLSHRAHNKTLQLHSEATRLQAEAGILHNKATNQWGYYQAWNIREHAYRTNLENLAVLPHAPGTDAESKKAAARWKKQVYKYEKGLPGMEAEARKYMQEGDQLQQEAKKKLDEAEHTHHLGDRYDIAELGVEIGLVLCSLAVLTKKRGFWYSGMACGMVGVVLMLVGVYTQYLVVH